jgi:hypothetical protein
VFERVVVAAMVMGLVKGEGFAVDASVMEANASRYHGNLSAQLSFRADAVAAVADDKHSDQQLGIDRRPTAVVVERTQLFVKVAEADVTNTLIRRKR